MNCMNCGAEVQFSDECPICRCDLKAQKRALQLSVQFYNQALDKAQVRDLSGAIDDLKRSLKYNKLNVDARNLLGLTYFEVGEAVSALSEWVLSKNIQPENNLAEEYIMKLQEDPGKLDVINQTIQKYNFALQCCRSGNDDVAAVQLKKILVQNPKLIKAYHLMALINIHHEEYEAARTILRKAAQIDKTNATTLRFLHEIDEQTGTITSLEGHRRFRRNKKNADLTNESLESLYYGGKENVVVQATPFRESPAFGGMVNLLVGIVVGVLLLYFLIVPSVRREANRIADEKVTAYSSTMASQANDLANLNTEIDNSNSTVESAKESVKNANDKVVNYENLMAGYIAYRNNQFDQALNALQNVDTTKLSVDGKAVYDLMGQEVQSQMFNKYWTEGQQAFDAGNYPLAIENLTKAHEINADDYNVLTYLAHSYRLNGDPDQAIAVFTEIIEKNPNTRRATTAQMYITQLQNGNTGDNEFMTGDEPETTETDSDEDEEEESSNDRRRGESEEESEEERAQEESEEESESDEDYEEE